MDQFYLHLYRSIQGKSHWLFDTPSENNGMLYPLLCIYKMANEIDQSRNETQLNWHYCSCGTLFVALCLNSFDYMDNFK